MLSSLGNESLGQNDRTDVRVLYSLVRRESNKSTRSNILLQLQILTTQKERTMNFTTPHYRVYKNAGYHHLIQFVDYLIVCYPQVSWSVVVCTWITLADCSDLKWLFSRLVNHWKTPHWFQVCVIKPCNSNRLFRKVTLTLVISLRQALSAV